MQYFLIRRVTQMAVLMLFISALIYLILNLVPGGPFDALRFANPRISAEHVKQLERLLGLDRPIHERYFIWLMNVVRGDWGESWGVSYGQPVLEIIQSRLGNTLILMGTSLVFSVIIALPIGIYSAIRQYSPIDYLVTTLSFFGMSMPTFWFGIMMLIVFAVGLRWLPAGGISTPGMEGDILDRLRHLALPATVLSLFNVAGWSRYIRSSMLEVLGQDYLRTARAKGLAEQTVVIKHALRNALIPFITLVGLTLPDLFGGAIITETIFAYSGMGILYYNAIMASDWPLVQAIMVMLAFLVVASNLFADVLYAFVDPRIRYD
ncbi:MAG: ABC transporter permease [Dehalococcoidales bacterium]|nr:ABC transporter permease [Dehalococcoidales bacterium]